MFEGVAQLIQPHAQKLDERLTHVNSNLSELIDAVRSSTVSNEYRLESGTTLADAESETAIVKLKPEDGFMWRVRRVAVLSGTQEEEGEETEGRCAIYLNQVAESNFLGLISPASIHGEDTRIVVPERSELIFHFYSVKGGLPCVANIQVEQFQNRNPRQPHNLKQGGESHTQMRVPPIPSGNPMNEPSIV